MAIKVKAVERLIKFNKSDAGTYRYVMAPEMYSSLAQDKVIKEAALRSGVSKGVMQACWDAAARIHVGEPGGGRCKAATNRTPSGAIDPRGRQKFSNSFSRFAL